MSGYEQSNIHGPLPEQRQDQMYIVTGQQNAPSHPATTSPGTSEFQASGEPIHSRKSKAAYSAEERKRVAKVRNVGACDWHRGRKEKCLLGRAVCSERFKKPVLKRPKLGSSQEIVLATTGVSIDTDNRDQEHEQSEDIILVPAEPPECKAAYTDRLVNVIDGGAAMVPSPLSPHVVVTQHDYVDFHPPGYLNSPGQPRSYTQPARPPMSSLQLPYHSQRRQQRSSHTQTPRARQKRRGEKILITPHLHSTESLRNDCGSLNSRNNTSGTHQLQHTSALNNQGADCAWASTDQTHPDSMFRQPLANPNYLKWETQREVGYRIMPELHLRPRISGSSYTGGSSSVFDPSSSPSSSIYATSRGSPMPYGDAAHNWQYNHNGGSQYASSEPCQDMNGNHMNLSEVFLHLDPELRPSSLDNFERSNLELAHAMSESDFSESSLPVHECTQGYGAASVVETQNSMAPEWGYQDVAKAKETFDDTAGPDYFEQWIDISRSEQNPLKPLS